MSRSRPAPRLRWRAPRGMAVPGHPRRASTVIMGMGNPLLGDDGAGWALARCIARHPALPPDVHVAWGGTDLMTTSSLLDGRLRVVLIDVVEADVPGRLVVLDPAEEEAAGVEASSLRRTLRLLRTLRPELDGLVVRVLGVTVAPVRPGADLSPAVRERLPELADRILGELT